MKRAIFPKFFTLTPLLSKGLPLAALLLLSRAAFVHAAAAAESSKSFPSTFSVSRLAVSEPDEEGGKNVGAVGDQEVEAAKILWEQLGVRCRSTAETLEDMVSSMD